MRLDQDDYLAHYGTLRKSGRYPWGSGETQNARNQTFLGVVKDLEKQGMTKAEIAKGFSSDEHPLTSTDIIRLKTIAKDELKQDKIRQVERYVSNGLSNTKIGERMGMNESSVRALRDPGNKAKAEVLKSTTEMLRNQVAEKKYLDIGVGVHHDLKISEDKFKTAVAKLQEEGYQVRWKKVPQLSTGHYTNNKFLKEADTPFPKDPNEIRPITDHSIDSGHNWLGIKPPLSISSKRVSVRYAEDKGNEADGVIYVRPGVKDVSLWGNRYAQVRIAVDGTHFLKGMAIEKDGLPDGVDLVFNTNKSNTGNKLDAMKPFKKDKDNPFGSTIKQLTDDKGNVTSVMNIVGKKETAGVEGGWGEWSKSLASQVLSKQAPELAKGQLAMTVERKKNEFDEIMRLTNPTIKKKLLESFADDTDSSAIHLKAAALPGQSTHVILPVNSVKKGEIYATNYNNGDRVALIRYPHGGTFEIPELTVNNRNREAIKLLGSKPQDAVGIHHSVAERLSGADFDGDTVLVIPNHKGSIKSTPPLDRLRGFDSKSYAIPQGDTTTKRMTEANTQAEMGKITNLISDMTIRGAGTEKLSRAIRHSMVVIDAEKHGLDYKASFRDHGIAALKSEYQFNPESKGLGASTLITRAKSKAIIDQRRPARVLEGGPINPITGEKQFVNTNETYRTPDRIHKRTGAIIPGKEIRRTEVSTKLRETTDAHTLVSGKTGTRIERIYADHSNKLKALANEARLATLEVKPLIRSKSARDVYKKEVDALNSKLTIALENAPRERQAQRLAGAVYNQKRQAEPNMDNATKKKIKGQAEAEARVRTGAAKQRIVLTQREWDAIQAGAISNHMLKKILANTNLEQVKTLATPRAARVISSSKLARAKAMLASGYTPAEVATHLGVSPSTLHTYIK